MSDALDLQLAALVTELYASVLDEGRWTRMAARIAEAFGAPSAVIKVQQADQAADILQVTDNFGIAAADPEWAEHWHRNDLWVEEAAKRQWVGAATSQSLMPDAQLERTAYYNEWLKPLDIHTMVGALQPLEGGGTAVVGIHRPHGAAHFDESDGVRLNALLPHLRQALNLRQHFREHLLAAQTMQQALEGTKVAVLAVGADAQLLFANRVAELVLRSQTVLRVVGGRIRAIQPGDDARLQQALRDGQTEGAVPRPLRLAVDGPSPMAVTLLPLLDQAHELGAVGPVMLLVMRGEAAPADAAAQLLRPLFDLTPAEARVAVALAQGRSLNDMARLLGVGLTTVRTHVRGAMAKTGTHQQSQLVAIVWQCVGPLPLAISRPSEP